MARVLVLALLAAVGAQAQPQTWKFVGAVAGRPGAVVKNAPFSAVMTTETAMVLQDGNHIRQTSTQHVYRDSEGRTRREQSLDSVGGLANNTNLPTVVFINDPVAGFNYALNLSSKTATRTAGRGRGQPGNRGGRLRAALGNGQANVKTESLGSKTMEGVSAEGTRTTITIPTGQVGNEQPLQAVIETWYSPDLQLTLWSKRDDPRTGVTITRYSNISRTEPAHSLFEVPADYKITEPETTGPHSGSK